MEYQFHYIQKNNKIVLLVYKPAFFWLSFLGLFQLVEIFLCSFAFLSLDTLLLHLLDLVFFIFSLGRWELLSQLKVPKSSALGKKAGMIRQSPVPPVSLPFHRELSPTHLPHNPLFVWTKCMDHSKNFKYLI